MLPLEFQPLLKRARWGGRRLADLGKSLGAENDYAESWELAEHGEDQTHVIGGQYDGWSTARLVRERNQEIFGRHAGREQFPLLVKFLDANDRLSVQVHPNDEQARQYAPGANGKTEAWVICEAAPGSRLYAGLRAGVTAEQLREAIDTGDVEPLLHSFEVTPGETIFIPAGTVHAIGEGILLAEIQQMSDLTFRLHDWGRLGADGQPREVHLEEAIAVTDFQRGPVQPVTPRRSARLGGVTDELVSCPHFQLRRHILEKDFRIGPEDRFRIVMVLDGTGDLTFEAGAMRLSLGRTVLIPASAPLVTVHPWQEMTLLEATLP